MPLIIGGGPAGAAAAIRLLNAGVQPTIVERRAETGDALCGGFISWKTLEQLETLGLSWDELGGHEVTVLHVFSGHSAYALPLPRRSMALSRRRLDSLLLARAVEKGAGVRHATAAYTDGHVRLGSGESLASDSLFIATGKHDLHGLPRPREAAGHDPMLGLRLRLQPSCELAALLADHIEIHLFRGGYLGVVLQEDGSANFCMAVRKSRLAAADGLPAALFAQLAQDSVYLAERLAGMPASPDVDAVGRIPYGWRARSSPPGIFRLGDQAGVIPSLAGEGIGIALASAESAVQFWRQGGGAAAPAFQRVFARRLRRPLAAAGLIAALGSNPATAALPLKLLAATPGAAALIAGLTRI